MGLLPNGLPGATVGAAAPELIMAAGPADVSFVPQVKPPVKEVASRTATRTHDPRLDPTDSVQPHEPNPAEAPDDYPEEPDDAFELDHVADPLTPLGLGPDIAAWEAALENITPRNAQCPTETDQRERIRRLVSFLKVPPPPGGPRDLAAAEALLRNLPETLRNPDDFVSGSFSRYFPAWEQLIGNSGRKSSRQVLGWLKDGVKPVFVGTAEAKPSKRDLVIGMLKKVVPAGDIPALLSGQFPHPVQFENHQSFYDNWEFSSEAVNKLLLWSAASETPPGTEQPVVILPLGVADPAGKARLICNARYVNLFLQAFPFRYERLRDILAFTKEGSFMASWDLKAGYYHVPIHPAFRKYFGFRVGRRVFHFNVVFFGFAQACYIFTKIMQEPFLELRGAGIPVSGYVDDGLTAAITYFLCLHRLLGAVLLQWALGAFHSLPKCQFTPVQCLDWLGFQVDSRAQRFEVSALKLAKVKLALETLLDANRVSARDLARVAGKIISLSPAVAPAALYSRSFFEAITGKTSWDSVFPNPLAVQETAQFWLANLDRFNGRAWWPHPVRLTASVDASGVGFGGIISLPDGSDAPFNGTFSELQGGASSTLRELTGYVATVELAASRFPALLRGASILLTGDNQGAIAALNNLRSPVAAMNAQLRHLFDLSIELGCSVQGVWVPREQLTEADAISREPDASDWGISPALFAQICKRFRVVPSWDLFASDTHHTSGKFISKLFSPGCAAAQAFTLHWGQLVGSETAWVFPPLRAISAALSALERYRINALVVLPNSSTAIERIQLHDMQGVVVSGPFTIPRIASSCIPSLRVPANTLNPAFVGLQVRLLTWD